MSKARVTRACPWQECNEINTLEVDADGYASWRAGALIQVAFPDLSVADREFLLSGFCPKHMEAIFGYHAVEELARAEGWDEDE